MASVLLCHFRVISVNLNTKLPSLIGVQRCAVELKCKITSVLLPVSCFWVISVDLNVKFELLSLICDLMSEDQYDLPFDEWILLTEFVNALEASMLIVC